MNLSSLRRLSRLHPACNRSGCLQIQLRWLKSSSGKEEMDDFRKVAEYLTNIMPEKHLKAFIRTVHSIDAKSDVATDVYLERASGKAPRKFQWLFEWLRQPPQKKFPIAVTPHWHETDRNRLVDSLVLTKVTDLGKLHPVNPIRLKEITEEAALLADELLPEFPVDCVKELTSTLEVSVKEEPSFKSLTQTLEEKIAFHSDVTKKLKKFYQFDVADAASEKLLVKCRSKRNKYIGQLVRGLDKAFPSSPSTNKPKKEKKDKTAKSSGKANENQTSSKTAKEEENVKAGNEIEGDEEGEVEEEETEEDSGKDLVRYFVWKHCHKAVIKCRRATTSVSSNSSSSSSSTASGNSNNLMDLDAWEQSNSLDGEEVPELVDLTEHGVLPKSSSRWKVMIRNVPLGVTEQELTSALRRCGPVSSVRLHRFAAAEGPESFTSIKTPAAKSTAKKYKTSAVLKPAIPDDYSFVWFDTEAGYLNATRDDLRIFGVCIRGSSCRITPANQLRSLIVEIGSNWTTTRIKTMLRDVLGHKYDFRSPPQLDALWPVFVHLDFPTHQEAWEAFDLLTTCDASKGVVNGVSWVKHSVYNAVAEKERERKYRYNVFGSNPSSSEAEEKSLTDAAAKVSEGSGRSGNKSSLPQGESGSSSLSSPLISGGSKQILRDSIGSGVGVGGSEFSGPISMTPAEASAMLGLDVNLSVGIGSIEKMSEAMARMSAEQRAASDCKGTYGNSNSSRNKSGSSQDRGAVVDSQEDPQPERSANEEEETATTATLGEGVSDEGYGQLLRRIMRDRMRGEKPTGVEQSHLDAILAGTHNKRGVYKKKWVSTNDNGHGQQ